MQDLEQFKNLLSGYTRGALTPEEEGRLMDAIASGDHRQLLDTAIGSALQQAPEQQLAPEQQQRIIQQILSVHTSREQITPVRTLTSSRKKWYWAAAAGLVFAAGLATLVHHTPKNKEEKPLFAGISDIRDQKNTSTAPLSVHLDDGSEIDLAPGARLEYPAHFTGATRTVRLEGNAFFRIAANAQKPFYAYSRQLVTHVLGTSFSITYDERQAIMKVAVRSGKVEVYQQQDQQGPVLIPNQQVVCAKDDKTLTPSLVDTPEVLQEGRPLVFTAKPVSEICTLLKDRYGINIIMEDPKTGADLFTGDLSHQSFYTALKIICGSLNMSYTVKGIDIIIKK